MKWILELDGGPAFAANAATMCRLAASEDRPDGEREILERLAAAADVAVAAAPTLHDAPDGMWDKVGLPIRLEALPVAKYVADAAAMGGKVFVLGDWIDRRRTKLEVHADGTVIAPDGWEAVIEDGLLVGARPLRDL